MNWIFKDIVFAIDQSYFLGASIRIKSHFSTKTRWRKKGSDSGTCRANPFRQIALWNEFQFELARAVQTVKHITICLARKAANQFVDPASFENRCQTNITIAINVAPIPGKSVVGIEVPNLYRETVSMKEVMTSESFSRARSKLSLALGKVRATQVLIAVFSVSDWPSTTSIGKIGRAHV